ncbi:MAG: hypothetical protein WCJ03_07200 [Bacteroidales bacterium]
MITIQQIYDATDNGLRIIKYFYPQAIEGKAFSVRDGEKTPSAYIKEIKGVWRLTDFGQSDEAQSPIDIIMKELNVKVGEAIYWAAREFGVSDDVITKKKNIAKIERREATTDETDGLFTFSEKEFTESELRLLGNRVTAKNCENLSWMSLEYYRRTKKDKNTNALMTTTINSTDNYPVFMRKCVYLDAKGEPQHFFKIYQPLDAEKQYRFFHEGNKPPKYINGLSELKARYKKHNEEAREIFDKDPKNAHKEYKAQKLSEAFICSGERDALCIDALGYSPIWFNSESYNLTDAEYYELKKYVDRIYNIPDIDETGIRKGRELANKYIEIYTVWLPDTLRTYTDNRQRPRKDLRDFVEIWKEKKDFDNLVNLAMPVQFWETKYNKGVERLEINSDFLKNFLSMSGFYRIDDKTTKQGFSFIQVRGNVVYKITHYDIIDYLSKFSVERYLDIDVRNLINNSVRISENSLNRLSKVELDFTDFTFESQYFYFQNIAFNVKADEIIQLRPSELKQYVWEDEVIPHKVSRLDPAFAISEIEKGVFDIAIHHQQSKFMNFLINTSRIYWRKEFETQFADNLDSDEAKAYRAAHQFDLSSSYISADESYEQRLHLINKIFALGYIFHRHKRKNRAWCVFAMDNKIAEYEECNGGSGKSIFTNFPTMFMKTAFISGATPDVIKNTHIYETVTDHTDYLLIDDADKYIPFRFFFDAVTNNVKVNPKFGKNYTVDFDNAPKYAISSNFTLDRFDGSTERRVLYTVFGDYYHQQTDSNGYLESRSVYDDFNKNLFSNEYSEDEWNADINFMIDCTQFYLSTLNRTVKIQPPMKNVIARNLRANMTDVFYNWAEVYFDKEDGYVDQQIQREKALNDFANDTRQMKWTTNKFSAAIQSFCRYHKYTLNPECFLNSARRNTAKIEGKSVEMIYIQTKDTIAKNDYEKLIPESDESGKSKLPF